MSNSRKKGEPATQRVKRDPRQAVGGDKKGGNKPAKARPPRSVMVKEETQGRKRRNKGSTKAMSICILDFHGLVARQLPGVVTRVVEYRLSNILVSCTLERRSANGRLTSKDASNEGYVQAARSVVMPLCLNEYACLPKGDYNDERSRKKKYDTSAFATGPNCAHIYAVAKERGEG
ncbi:hypothetical protein K474DRAFT_1676017 [Panus rudis PR-1116 ss-1]|nr:hypothetical protein K474DRAFT_1676017 [Panus rudis PR-1116 ss-1]